MKEVKRYEAGTEWGNPVMSEYPFGDWVSYEDYAALKAERDALAAENAALTELYRQAVKELDDTCFEMGMMRGEKSMEYPAPETPATDAYLNSVRAEGASACGIHLREWYDYQVEQRAEEFAAQLRAGEPS